MEYYRSCLGILIGVSIAINTYVYGMLGTVRGKGLPKFTALPTRVTSTRYPTNPYVPISKTTSGTLGHATQLPPFAFAASPLQAHSFHTTPVRQQKDGDIYTGSWRDVLTNFIRVMKGKPTFSAMVHNFRLFLEKGIGYEALEHDIITGAYDGILNTPRKEAYYLNIQNRNVTVLDDCIVRLARLDLFGLSTTASGGPWKQSGNLQSTSFIEFGRTAELMDLITLLVNRGAKTSFISPSDIFKELACVYGFFDKFRNLYTAGFPGFVKEYLQFLKGLAKLFFTPGIFFVGKNLDSFEDVFDYFANVPLEYRNQQQHTESQQTSEQASVLKRNLTEMLGLTTSATDAEIKEAYHILVRKLHPDVLRRLEESEKVVQESEQKLKKLTEVYTTYMRHAK
jgi:DnaJ domain